MRELSAEQLMSKIEGRNKAGVGKPEKPASITPSPIPPENSGAARQSGRPGD